MDKVSVIIPIYNASKYLPFLFEDLLNQKYDNYEVIAVNDKSTDDTRDIITRYQDRFNNSNTQLILVDRETNGGLCAAINSGLNVATGDYYWFPDADDELSPNFISDMMQELRNNPGKEWVRCDYTIVLEDENREYDVNLPENSVYKNDFFDFLSKYIAHNAWNMIVSRDYFERCIGEQIYDSRLTQEWSLLLPLSYHSNYARCNKKLYRYHIRKNAMSSWQNQAIESVIEHINGLEVLNNTIIDSIDDGSNDIEIARKVTKLYYHLFRYKKYCSAGYEQNANYEKEELYKESEDCVDATMKLIIDNLDMYVRIVFDQMMHADVSEAIENYKEYSEILADEYELVFDKGGKELKSTMENVYGKAKREIDAKEILISEHTLIPKLCLIQNSKVYEQVNKSIGDAICLEYRSVRDSLRGWGVLNKTNA